MRMVISLHLLLHATSIYQFPKLLVTSLATFLNLWPSHTQLGLPEAD